RWLNISNQSPFETGVQTFFDLRNITRRAIGREHDLLLSIVQSIESVEKLFLCSLFAGDELHIINQQNIDAAVPLAKRVRLVVAETNCANQFIHEPFERKISDSRGWISGGYRMTDCLKKMSLSQTHTTVEIERVVSLARRLRYRHRRGVS